MVCDHDCGLIFGEGGARDGDGATVEDFEDGLDPGPVCVGDEGGEGVDEVEEEVGEGQEERERIRSIRIRWRA